MNDRLKYTHTQWFSEKWNIPIEAYYDSIKKCIVRRNKIP